MGFIGDIAGAIIDVITGIVEVVVDVVSSIISAVVNFISENIILVALIAAGVVIIASGGFAIMMADLALECELLALAEVSYMEIGAYAIAGFVDAIGICMGSFLEVIHFSTLLQIHQVAYILSGDYREMMSHVYDEIAEVSVALGLGSGYLILLHRNARNVILDVSGMMGRSYDLAEITWLQQYSDYLKKFNERVNIYKTNPGMILHDVDEYLVKPAADLKGAVVSNIILTIDSTVAVMKDTVTDVSKLRTDLGQLISDLPPKIRSETKPFFDEVFLKYDDWIREDYKPAIKVFDQLIGALKVEQDTHRQNIGGLVDRLKRPADYLLELDNFDLDLKREQEDSIHELSSRTYMRQAYDVRSDIGPVTFAFQKLAEALTVSIPPPEWKIPEKIEPGRPARTPVEPRETWDVGDY